MSPERNNIQKHIHRLRQKPEHVRRRYAATISGIIVAVIAVIWGVTFPSRFPNLLGQDNNSQQAAVVTGLSTDNSGASQLSPVDQSQSGPYQNSGQTSQIENGLNQGNNYSPVISQPSDSSNNSVSSNGSNSSNSSNSNYSSTSDGVIILQPEQNQQ
jgi:hypothetical protein